MNRRRRKGDAAFWRLYEHLRRDHQLDPRQLERCLSMADLRATHDKNCEVRL